MSAIQHITYAELQDWRAAGEDFQLIDVREPEEHEAYNIGGELIPLGDLLQQQEKIDAEKPVVFYCKRGIRSQIAIQRLAQKFPGAAFFNLQGGILHLRSTPME
jgi:adenylyltransferase/sulfurtransferase